MFAIFRQSKWRLGFFLLSPLLSAAVAWGQSPQQPSSVQAVGADEASHVWTLSSLIDELKKNNPQLRSARGVATAAQYGVEPARAPDNPTFNITQSPVSYNPFAVGTSQGMTWSVSQNLPWPGKRRLGGEIAQAQADLTSAQVDSLQVQLIGQLKTAWSSWQ
jgi:outer membrane protein TolC